MCGLLLLELFSCFSWVRVLRTVQTGLGGRIAKSRKGQSYDRQVLMCVCQDVCLCAGRILRVSGTGQ